MRKVYGWMAKHRLLAIILGSIFLCGVYTLLMLDVDTQIWLVVLMDLFLIYMNCVMVDNAVLYYLKKPIAELDNNCNPIPLGLELEKLLTYKNSKITQQNLLINYTLALSCIGSYEKCYEILSSINIDKSAQTLPANKVIYYNNLMDVCMNLEKYEEACIWYSKAMQIYADMKNSKQKKRLKSTMRAAEAIYYFCTKEYDRAIQIIDTNVSPHRRSSVEDALFYAKVCIAAGDVHMAKEKLEFVIQNGNKLGCVDWAKNMLEQLQQ